jgi:hypothetical protein
MVLQYKKRKDTRWKKYPGKNKLKEPTSKYQFRLLTENKSKILAEGSYNKVMKRFKAIEFFKHKK